MSYVILTDTTSCVNYQNIGFDSTDVVMLDPYEILKSKIDSFASLSNNWDGYGGIPTLDVICENAHLLLSMLSSTYLESITDLFPNPNGTLTIDWENLKNEKISLEIGKANYSFFVKYLNKDSEFKNGENIIEDFKILAKALGELFGEAFFTFIP